MIRITSPSQQRRFTAGIQEIILDYCAVALMQLSTIGADVYAHGARVMVVWGRKNASGEFVAAEPLVHEEFSLANVREEKRLEYFQRADSPAEAREVVSRPAERELEQLMTPPAQSDGGGQANRRFGDVRMRDFEEWLVSSGKVEGVVE